MEREYYAINVGVAQLHGNSPRHPNTNELYIGESDVDDHPFAIRVQDAFVFQNPIVHVSAVKVRNE